MRLVVTQPPWVRGCADAVWWRRVSQPHLPAWAAAGRPLRLVEQPVAKQTKRHGADPKALAGYGLLARWHPPDAPRQERVWLRFVDGRPLSGVTTRFRAWGCAKLAAAGKTALLRVWDHASWHISREVQAWIRAHNRQVRATRHGVRSVVCPLPTTRPWLHPIERRPSKHRDAAEQHEGHRAYHHRTPGAPARRPSPADSVPPCVGALLRVWGGAGRLPQRPGAASVRAGARGAEPTPLTRPTHPGS